MPNAGAYGELKRVEHPVEPQGLITLRSRHGMKMVLTPRG